MEHFLWPLWVKCKEPIGFHFIFTMNIGQKSMCCTDATTKNVLIQNIFEKAHMLKIWLKLLKEKDSQDLRLPIASVDICYQEIIFMKIIQLGFVKNVAGLLTFLGIFLISSGCSTVQLPQLADQERCVISIELNKCRCHQYRVSPEKVGRVSDSVDRPVEYCERFVGFSPDSWVEFVLWLEETFEAVNDANEQKLTRPVLEHEMDIMEMVDGL